MAKKRNTQKQTARSDSAKDSFDRYADPDFSESIRDQVISEAIAAFQESLVWMHSRQPEAVFMKEKGIYTGPYIDSPQQEKDTAENREALLIFDRIMPEDAPGTYDENASDAPRILFSASEQIMQDKIDHVDNGRNDNQDAARSLTSLYWDVFQIESAVRSCDINKLLENIYHDEWRDFRTSFPRPARHQTPDHSPDLS